MEVVELARIVLTLLSFVGIGWLTRRFGVLSAGDARPLHSLIVYVALPAMIFQAVHPAPLSGELVLITLVAWVIFAVSAAGAWALSRAMNMPRRLAGAFILAASLGNTSYLGYPVAHALFGNEGLVRAIFYDVTGTVAAMLIVGMLIAQRFGERVGPELNPLAEVVRFPAVIALVAGFALHPFAIPEVVSSGLDALAKVVAPLIMISVGLTLEVKQIRNYPAALGALAVVKLLLGPLLALMIGTLVLDDPATIRLVVLQAGMPTMMLTAVVGARFRLDTEFIASAIVVTMMASVLALPLMQLVLG